MHEIQKLYQNVKKNTTTLEKEIGQSLVTFNSLLAAWRINEQIKRCRLKEDEEQLFAVLYFRHHTMKVKEVAKALGYKPGNDKQNANKFLDAAVAKLEMVMNASSDKETGTPPPAPRKPFESSAKTPQELYDPSLSKTLGPNSGTVDLDLHKKGEKVSTEESAAGDDHISRKLFSSDDELRPQQLGENKYNLKGWYTWRDVDQAGSRALLVLDKDADGVVTVNTSPEFAEFMSLPRNATEKWHEQGPLFPSTMTHLSVLPPHRVSLYASPDLGLCSLLFPPSSGEWTGLMSYVFIPSRGRAATFDEQKKIHDAYNDALYRDRFARIIVVEPHEAEEYANLFLRRNCAILVLPQSSQGAGYARHVSQCYANSCDMPWIWMVDDSAVCFFGPPDAAGDSKNIRQSMTQPAFLAAMESRMNEQFDDAQLAEIATVGTVKSRGDAVKNEYKSDYASSMFRLNVKQTCEKGVYFDVKHRCAEDICFNVRCTAKGLSGLVDKQYAHQKAPYKHGGAYDQTSAYANKEAEEHKQVETLREDSVDVEICDLTGPPLQNHCQLTLLMSHCGPNTTIRKLQPSSCDAEAGSSGAAPLHCAVYCRQGQVSIQAGHSSVNNDDDSHTDNSLQTFCFGMANLSLHAGYRDASTFVLADQECASVSRLVQRDGVYAKESIDCAILQGKKAGMTISCVAETDENSLWISANANKCHRVDYRQHQPAASLSYEIATGTPIVQLTAVKDFEIVGMKSNGDLIRFDSRKCNTNIRESKTNFSVVRSNDDRKNNFSTVQTFIQSTGHATRRHAQLYSVKGCHLLTYNNGNNGRCGLVLNSDFKMVHNEPITFTTRNPDATGRQRDPSFVVNTDGSVTLTETYYQRSNSTRVVRVWNDREQDPHHQTRNRFQFFSVPTTKVVEELGCHASLHSACPGSICLPSSTSLHKSGIRGRQDVMNVNLSTLGVQ